MKKIYMKPTMDVTHIQLEQVIATSNVKLYNSKAATESETGFRMDEKDDYDYDEDLW